MLTLFSPAFCEVITQMKGHRRWECVVRSLFLPDRSARRALLLDFTEPVGVGSVFNAKRKDIRRGFWDTCCYTYIRMLTSKLSHVFEASTIDVGIFRVLKWECFGIMWVVVKITVPVWIPFIILHPIFRVPKRDHNFYNHPM